MKTTKITPSQLKKIILEEVKLLQEQSQSPIRKFVYFGYNYPYDFIEKVWEDDPLLAEHLKGKFKLYYNQYGPEAVMNKFYVELDAGNQKILEDWIINNFRA